jgi:exopolysaccharide biosynthesis polyprenyl glycosylphosphotransferase
VFEPNKALFLLLSDLVMLAVASVAAVWFVTYANHTLAYGSVLESAIIWTASSIWMFAALGLYRISYALHFRDEWYYVIMGLTIGIAPLLLLFTAVPALSSSRLVLAVSFGLSVVFVGISRSVIHGHFATAGARRRRRVTLVAAAEDLAAIAKTMQTTSISLNLLAAPRAEEAISAALDASRISWYDRVKEEGCDEIIFAGMPTASTALMAERAARDRITIGFAPSGLSSQLAPLGVRGAQQQALLVAGRVAACRPVNLFLKRVFDIAVAVTALVVSAPIMLAAALAIFLESGRPIIFRQTRVGRSGRPFEILKLRSMVQDAEKKCGPVWAIGDPVNDSRTTRVGAFIRKTSIDELPQFINVLRGDMSIVGPRPERPSFVERFRREYARYDERHLVRPGITGWAHVHMRRSPGLELIGERLDLDLFYIENYSLMLDVFITFKTGVEVLFQRWY